MTAFECGSCMAVLGRPRTNRCWSARISQDHFRSFGSVLKSRPCTERHGTTIRRYEGVVPSPGVGVALAAQRDCSRRVSPCCRDYGADREARASIALLSPATLTAGIGCRSLGGRRQKGSGCRQWSCWGDGFEEPPRPCGSSPWLRPTRCRHGRDALGAAVPWARSPALVSDRGRASPERRAGSAGEGGEGRRVAIR